MRAKIHPRWALLALFTVTALLLVPAPAGANGGGDLVVLVIEDDGCQGDAPACFQFETGGPANFTAGGHGVELVVENRASASYSVHVAALEDADPARNTSTEDAFISIDPLAPGENTTRSFHPASHFEGIYLFSASGGAEGQGLWYEIPYEGTATSGAPSDPGGQGPNKTPGLGAQGLLLLAVLALFVPERTA